MKNPKIPKNSTTTKVREKIRAVFGMLRILGIY
jgi:hypothetical protein